MYEKMLKGRKILYFRHAPPFTNLDDISARDTQPPFEEAPGYQCSVFYYWWAFLRESKAYKECCDQNGAGPLADLYSYFGDVRDPDFMRWWRLCLLETQTTIIALALPKPVSAEITSPSDNASSLQKIKNLINHFFIQNCLR